MSDRSAVAEIIEGAMPFYHFDLVTSRTVTEEGGRELADDILAMDCADAMARRLLERQPSLKKRDCAILVTSESGEEVCRLPLDVIH